MPRHRSEYYYGETMRRGGGSDSRPDNFFKYSTEGIVGGDPSPVAALMTP